MDNHVALQIVWPFRTAPNNYIGTITIIYAYFVVFDVKSFPKGWLEIIAYIFRLKFILVLDKKR